MHPVRSGAGGGEAHFQRCWRHQNCGDCLAVEHDCGWCPFSWTCVPNSNRLPLMAPAYDENVCPHWAERWEIRTRPLGCQVSTITTLASLVTIASTLLVVLLGFLAVVGARRLRAYDAAHPDWWSVWRWTRRGKRDDGLIPERTPHETEHNGTGPPEEREPLLSS